MIYKQCRFDNLKDNSRICMIDDKIQNYTVMNSALHFSRHFSSLLSEMTHSNKQPENSDVIKATNLCTSDVTLTEKEAYL